MTDFIISEEQLNTYPYENPVWRKKTEAAIRSRPLSDELKKERERLQPLIDAAQEFVDRCDHNEIRSVYTYNKFKGILKSLRGEPIKDITVGNSGGNR